ncbi:MAG TPA: response regulator transcription factor [Cytophagaceae bacterium]|jgi:two-component system copper resistance phosphate regulon response regulator CusR|nr:response regulator transcription factor [Cytophagaceae bacterium]
MLQEILIIEDEPKVANSIKQGFDENGFDATVAHDGKVGLKLALTGTYHLIILDLNLPHMNGFDICKEIRSHKLQTPIIMLTAFGDIEDKMQGFGLGADDYVVKPFNFRELLARARVFLKRSSGEDIEHHTQLLKIANLEINTNMKSVMRNGRPIELTAKEYMLLEYMVRNKGRVLSKIEIAEKVWDLAFDTGTNVIEVYINFLRKKIDKDSERKLIFNKPGLGYYIKED